MSSEGAKTARAPSRWDVFVSHASEDKDAIARPLAKELRSRGLRVWYDEFELKIGDSLSEKIDEGLADSHHGIVILSPQFFVKDWSKKELAGLTATEDGRRNRILPVWHMITREEVAARSPTLVDRKAATAEDVGDLADELIQAMDQEGLGTEASAEGLSLSPPPAQVELSLTVGGRNALEQIAGRHEHTADIDLIQGSDLRKEVARQLDELIELAGIWTDLPLAEREPVATRASEIMISMLEHEVMLELGPYERRLTSKGGESSPWRGIVIRAIPASLLAKTQHQERGQVTTEPDPSDQAQLDELLGLLTRPSLKRLQAQDFHSSWPEKVTTPFQFLAWDYDEIEYSFKDSDLEAERQRLVQAANDFLHKEALNGYPSKHVPGLRDTGFTPGEAEGIPQREKLMAPRQQTILDAAATLVDVYDDFVRVAKDKGYNLEAMKTEVHPKVADHDREMQKIHSGG